jgi:Flp pilus assembly protein TadG
MNTLERQALVLAVPSHEQAREQKGSVLVEFAFILPVLLMLLFGVVYFSVALYNKTVLTMATREGARAGVRYDADGNNTANAVNAATPLCDSVISFGTDDTPVPQASVSGDILTVTASTNYTGLYIFSGLTISAQTSMRLE